MVDEMSGCLVDESLVGSRVEKKIIKYVNPMPRSTYNSLTPEEQRIIVDKGTETPFTGEYEDLFQKGTYLCRRCNTPLYTADSKFHSGCGWPSFDQEIAGAVKRTVDPDGQRVEITCGTCEGHLGHIFQGEGYTATNSRHCVNSLSLKFIPNLSR